MIGDPTPSTDDLLQLFGRGIGDGGGRSFRLDQLQELGSERPSVVQQNPRGATAPLVRRGHHPGLRRHRHRRVKRRIVVVRRRSHLSPFKVFDIVTVNIDNIDAYGHCQDSFVNPNCFAADVALVVDPLLAR